MTPERLRKFMTDRADPDDVGRSLHDAFCAAADEIEMLRGFIARRYPGFDVDEAVALHDVAPPHDGGAVHG